MKILETIWAFVNSPIGITAAAAVLLWLLNKLFAWRPAWRAFEGTIIAGIKWAEREIPDDADNKAVRKLDAALGYVVKLWESTRKKPPTAKEIGELREGIQIKHAELEAAGSVGKKPDAGPG